MDEISCKYCQSANTIKYGTRGDMQLYYCKDCERKFTELDTLPKMQFPIAQVAAAVSMYYEGLSLNEIKRILKQIYNCDVSDYGIYGWVERFTKDAIRITDGYHPEAGYVWCADETVIDIAGKQYWLLDVLDYKTRFLLASRISPYRRIEDIQAVLKEAYERSGKVPKVIMTDNLPAYINAVPLTFGNESRHLRVKKFTAKPNNNLIERMQGTIKSRTKVMRDLKSVDTANTILDGFIIHYNYFRPHETLSTSSNSVTPAEKANIKFPYVNWEELIRNTPRVKKEVSTTRFDLPALHPAKPSPVQNRRERERLRKRIRREERRQGILVVRPTGRPRKNP